MIIGITGTLGAGKGTIVEYLKQRGFQHYSARQFITEEIKRQQLPVNRDSMVKVANGLREEHGPSYIIRELYAQAEFAGGDGVIESIRTSGEVEAMRQLPDFFLLAVDAKPEIRYARVKARGSETDHVSYQEFLDNEEREMHSTDPNKQNLSACIAAADAIVLNNGSFEDLYKQVDQVLPMEETTT